MLTAKQFLKSGMDVLVLFSAVNLKRPYNAKL